MNPRKILGWILVSPLLTVFLLGVAYVFYEIYLKSPLILLAVPLLIGYGYGVDLIFEEKRK